MPSIFDLSHYYFNINSLPFFIFAGMVFLFGVFIFFKNSKSALNISFAVFCSLLTVWFFGRGMAFACKNEVLSAALHKYYVFLPSSLAAPTFLLLFFIALRQIKQQLATIIFSYLCVLLLYWLAMVTPLSVLSSVKTYWGWRLHFSGPIVPLLFIIFYGILLFGLYIFLRGYKELYDYFFKRRALYMVFAGLLFSFPRPDYFMDFYPLAEFFVFASSVVAVYAIYKFQKTFVVADGLADNVVSNITDLVFLLDPEFKITFINPAVTELLGYGQKELSGKPFSSVCLKNDLADLAQKGVSVDAEESVFIGKNKKKIELIASSAPVFADRMHKKFLGVAIMARDTRELQKALKDLKAQNEKVSVIEGELRSKAAELSVINEKMIKREDYIVELKKKIKRFSGIK